MRPISCAVLALAVAMPAFAADVYRTVADDGTVTYSDRPDGDGAELLSLAVTGSTAASRAAAPSSGARSQTARANAEPAAPETRPRELTAAERAEERERNCETARERAERYAVSHRLYRTTPDGEREYLDDAEIDEARERAAADVETWCG